MAGDTITVSKRDEEMLLKLRRARDGAQNYLVEESHYLKYPSWYGDLSFVLGYFEGRFGFYTGENNEEA